MDTIFAVSSGVGRSAIAVVRMSGPGCVDVAHAMCGRPLQPRQATLVKLRDHSSGEVLDHGLALMFPAPASFTGEDCLEFHLHGGRAVVQSVLNAIGQLDGLRLAEPGEFTRRAFQNGKLDLDSAEGLADLIQADTILQQRQALSALGGSLERSISNWRAQLVEAQAMLEAWLDFPDEDDVSDSLISDCQQRLAGLFSELEVSIEGARKAEILRDGVRVLIAGPPNVGKSSLLNRVALREVALVTDVPGTTRDIIEIRLDVGGVPLVVLDGAGIRDTEDFVEKMGIERVKGAASAAQIIVWLTSVDMESAKLPEWVSESGCEVIQVASKIDLSPSGFTGYGVSALTGDGIMPFLDELGRRGAAILEHTGEYGVQLRHRHIGSVREVLGAINDSLGRLKAGRVELAVEECRSALLSLANVTKAVHNEDILDSVFRRFCIGK